MGSPGLKLVLTLTKLVFGLFVGTCGAVTVPKSTCEFLLTSREAREIAGEYVDQFDQDYFSYQLNPFALPGMLKNKSPNVIGNLEDVSSLRLRFKDRGRQLNLLIVAKDGISRSLSKPFLPMAFWVGLSLSPEQVRAASIRLGNGLIQDTNDEFTEFILTERSEGHSHFGIILHDWPDGSRTFLRFGFDVAWTAEIVIGLDVRCEDVARYVTPSTKEARYNDPWRVLTLHTNDGEYCRIPQAIFHRPARSGGTDRI